MDQLAVEVYSSGYRRSQHFGLFGDVAKQLSGRLACPFRWRPSSLSTTCLPGKRSGDHLRQLILEHAFAQRVRCGAVTDRRKASDSATYRRTIVAFHWHFHVITVLQVAIRRKESFCCRGRMRELPEANSRQSSRIFPLAIRGRLSGHPA